MHLVHLTASTLFGGPERQMLGLSTHLPDSIRTTILSFAEGGRAEAFMSAAAAAGVSACTLDHDTPQLRASLRELTRRLHDLRATHLLCHGYKANLIGRVAAHNNGLPAIAVSRGWTGEDRKVRLYERLDRWHLKRMDHVVAVSAGQAAKVRACGVPEANLSIIRNAARLDAFASVDPTARSRLRSHFQKPVEIIILAAGRLSPEKGFDTLIDAAAMLPATIGVVLFGEGGERSRLEAMIVERNLADRVAMPGHVADLDRLLTGADMMALPSHTEGLPNVILEASAAGLPVVATAVGGTPEVVAEGETGVLVEPGHAWKLAAKLAQLAVDAGLRRRMGDAGRALMHREFTFAAQAGHYQHLLQSMASATRRAA
jgi:glycosyltransferase involved in cell wall biosynthesis